MAENILRQVRNAASKRILYSSHALSQINAPDRMISTQEVRDVVFQGEIIEDYPEDTRGHSCLMLGQSSAGRPVHVVCAPKLDYLVIITAYLPSPREWESNWRTRKET